MMKLVYVTNESYIDHSYTIIEQLGKKTEITVFLLAKEETEEIKSWCTKLNAAFIRRKRFRNPFSFFSEISFMLRIKKSKADKIWFNTLTAYQVMIAKFLLKDFLVTVHDVEIHPETKDYYSVLALKLTFFLLRKKICVVSQTQANIFKKLYGFEPKVFPLPVINYFTEAGNKSDKLSYNPGCIKFFFFGAIEAYKGIEILIEAAEILENKNIKFEINIFGRVKYNKEELTNKIRKLKSVKLYDEFFNYQDIHKIYCENDLLILPYRQVTQCGPLLIGYNELVPSICSSLEGFREYVEDGKSGLLFNNTAEDLAKKMEMITENPKLIDKMKEYIGTETFNKFSMDSLCDLYINNLKN